MPANACSDCGRSLDRTVDRYFSVPAAPDGGPMSGGEDGEGGDGSAIYCRDCGFVRLNSDAALPAGAVSVHAPTGARR
jgi:hypothetical protein